jgi:hypothetical protein
VYQKYATVLVRFVVSNGNEYAVIFLDDQPYKSEVKIHYLRDLVTTIPITPNDN